MESAARHKGAFAPKHQRGASIVEAVIAMPILLIVILGAIQFGLVYEAKATLNHASLQAARLGAVRHADPDAIRRGLARGLVPLYSPDSSLAGVARSITQINTALVTDARVRILNPTREAFDDFGVEVESEREIPNDRLHTRSTSVGAQSGINIQDANLLKVQITYGYELQVPLVNWFISRVLLGVRRGADTFEQQLLRRTRIPIMATATVRMQSTARLNDAMVSVSDLPDLARIPSDAAPPPTSNESDEDNDEEDGGEGTSHPGDEPHEEDDSGSGLDEGFFGFGSGSSTGSTGGGGTGGSTGGGTGGGLNGGNPQSCTVGDPPSPFPGNDGPPGQSTPVPSQPEVPGWLNSTQGRSGATLDSIALASLSVGNPIHVVTGNKYQVESDIEALPGELGIGIERHYNSAATNDRSIIGAGWRLSYDAKLRNRNDGTIQIVQGDGRLLVFTRDATGKRFVAQRTADGTVEVSDDGARWRWPSGREMHFDSSGLLIRMQERNAATTLRYNEQSELIAVRDSQGRELRVDYYANGRLKTIRGPAQLGVRYIYDDKGNLDQAIGTDGRKRKYFYEDERHPHHLTGIAVGSVRPLAYGDRPELQRFATWRYDEQGRAVFSSHPDDAGKITLAFGSGHTDVTDAFGRVTRYMTNTRDGVAYVSEVRGAGCSKCGQGDSAYTYDKDFRPLEISTKAGGTLRHHYDENGRLERSDHIVAGKPRLIARYSYADNSVQPSRIQRPSVNPDQQVTLTLQYSSTGLLENLHEIGFSPDRDGFRVIERSTALEYDDAGRLTRIDGPRSDVDDWTDIEYDDLGRVIRVMSAAGEKTITEHDALGRPALIVERGRPSIRLNYDSRGRVVAVTQLRSRGERKIAYRYDHAGRLEEIVDSAGRRKRYKFDAAGRPNRLISNDSDVIAGIRYAPDDSIERVAAVGANGQLLRTLYYSYDADRRLKEVRDGDGQPLTQFAYLDNDALPDRKTDPLGQETWFGYDAFGQLASVLAPDGGLTRYDRDIAGRLANIRAPNDASTSYVYDDFGRRVEERSADRGTTTYRYDVSGNLVEKRDARGRTTKLRYDAANRLVTVTRDDGVFKLAYVDGLLSSVVGNGTGESFKYDADAQLAVHSRTIDKQTFVTRFTYDPVGRLATRELPSGARLRYRYTDTGALHSITRERWRGDQLLVQADPRLSAGEPHSGRLDALGRLAYGNGISSRTTYDARSGNIARRTIDGVANLTYQYDDAGRIRAMARDKSPRSYEYDSMGRLKSTTSPHGQFAFDYDTNGNRTSTTETAARQLLPVTSVSASGPDREPETVKSSLWNLYAAPMLRIHAPYTLASLENVGPSADTPQPNRAYTYEASSNRLKSVTDEIGTRGYRYDEAGHPVQIASRRFEYDSNGRVTELYDGQRLIAEYRYNFWGERVQKIVHSGGQRHVTSFIYEQQKLIAEANERGAITREYIYVDHHPVAMIDHGETFWVHTDHLGTPIAVTNQRRAIVWSADHKPFGEALVNSDPDRDQKGFALNLRFPGQYADEESGTHYNYFRDYDPSTGRYMTPDPLGTFDGTNSFAYVHGNPMSGFDSLGLYQQDVHYYMTLFLAITAGIDPSQARSIALAAAFLDENPTTRPVEPGTLWDQSLSARHNQTRLLRYHFVLSNQDGQTFEQYRNADLYAPLTDRSPQLLSMARYYGMNPVYSEGRLDCDRDDVQLQFFGEYLHAFADMFAHRDRSNVPYNAWAGGFGVGHGLQDGSLPDYTYNEGEWTVRGNRTFLMELRMRDEMRQSRFATDQRAITDRQLDVLYEVLRDFNATREDEQTTLSIRFAATADERWVNSLKVETLNEGLIRLGYSGIDLASSEYRFDLALAGERRVRAFEGLDPVAYPRAIFDPR